MAHLCYIAYMLQAIPRLLTSLVFPPECEICQAILSPKSDGVCAACDRSLGTIHAPHCPGCGRTVTVDMTRCGECVNTSFYFDHAYATAFYNGGMKELLHRYKFSHRKYLKKYLASRLLDFYRQHLTGLSFDSVIAVPLDEKRQAERGFNQAALLSRQLAKNLGLREDSAKFRRHKRAAIPQHRLNKEMRIENVADSFKVTNKNTFVGQKILLIDDILTTGLTASECAKTLKNAGAVSVTVLTCARGL